MPEGLGGRKRVAFEFSGMDDLRGDGVGGEGGQQEMRHATAGGEGNGDREHGSGAIHGQSSLVSFFVTRCYAANPLLTRRPSVAVLSAPRKDRSYQME